MANDSGEQARATDQKRQKRTITEIRDSKKTGEKMVYMSVPDYTSPPSGPRWRASTWRWSATAWP